MLLKYASENNCRWLSKLGVSPANYLKINLEKTLIASGVGFESEDGPVEETASAAINLSTD